MPIVIGHDEAEKFFYKWTQKNKEVMRAIEGTDHIIITYTELYSDVEGTINKVCKFLGTKESKAFFTEGRGNKKLDRRTPKQAVKNYSELKEYFSNTRWSKFFR